MIARYTWGEIKLPTLKLDDPHAALTLIIKMGVGHNYRLMLRIARLAILRRTSIGCALRAGVGLLKKGDASHTHHQNY